MLGVVHKLRLQEEGGRWSKKLTFCKLSYHRKCKRRGVGGQKKSNFVNVVCERPLRVKVRVGKTGSLGPLSRVIVYCRKCLFFAKMILLLGMISATGQLAKVHYESTMTLL